MSFMILIGTTPTTPPSYAIPASTGSPIIENAPLVRRHEATARNGLGAPVGISGELFTTIGRTVINSTGLAWWSTTAGLGSNVSTPVTVKLLDPLTGTWDWYTGTAWRPTFSAGQAGSKVRDFRIHISNLQATTSPETP
jgi:hypothetical protein